MKGAVVVHSIEEALREAGKYPSEDVYVIGGDSIYRQMLPYCTKAHVTKDRLCLSADTFFPRSGPDGRVGKLQKKARSRPTLTWSILL